MPNKRNYKGKSYNICLDCEQRGSTCNGPRTSDMPLERWKEFMRDMKDVEGLTYAEISARTNPPIAARTIEGHLAPGSSTNKDLMRETARAIENAILGSAQHPCYLSFLGDTSNKTNLEAEIARLNNELVALRTDSQKKIDHLLAENERKNRIIDKLLDK